MEYKYDVFISYSRKDSMVVDRICQELDKCDIKYFIDRKGLSGGGQFPIELEDAINDSKVVLFIASNNSYQSKFTIGEITYAFNRKEKGSIIPYVIDNSDLLTVKGLSLMLGDANILNILEHPIETVLMGDIHKRLEQRNTDDTVEATERTVKPLISSDFSDNLRAGDALYENKQYKEAKASYQVAEKYASTSTTPSISQLRCKIAECAYKIFIAKNNETEVDAIKLAAIEAEATKYYALTQDYDADSLFFLGDIAEFGKSKNKELAFKRYLEAAQKGSKLAVKRIKTEIEQLESDADNFLNSQDYEKALHLYYQAIKLGSDHKYYEFAKTLYELGDFKKAHNWFQKASEQKNMEALFYLGIMHKQGVGVDVNAEEAFDYLYEAAQLGHVLAEIEVSKVLFSRGEIVNAKIWLRKAAEQGNAQAQYEYAKSIDDRDGAVNWYEKAAEQGVTEAMMEVADYWNGTEKHTLAIIWYRKAFERETPGAKEKLLRALTYQASSYDIGDGNEDSLLELYLEAAELGDNLHYKDIADLYIFEWVKLSDEKFARSQIAQAIENEDIKNFIKKGKRFNQGHRFREEAKKWYLKAAEQGNEKAQYCLAIICHIDSPNIVFMIGDETEKWLLEAAKNGHILAQHELAYVYADFYQQKKSAREWLITYADKGNAEAQYYIGCIYEKRQSTQNKAFEYILKSANQDYIEALLKIAQMYEVGKGITANLFLASKYYLRAIELGHNNIDFSLKVALLLQKVNNEKAAIKLYRNVIKTEENPEAIFQLAQMISEGRGTETNFKEALGLLEKVPDSKKGDEYYRLKKHIETKQQEEFLIKVEEERDARSLVKLGHNSKDLSEKIKWFRKGIECGATISDIGFSIDGNYKILYEIGNSYYYGYEPHRSIHKDYKKSAECYKLVSSVLSSDNPIRYAAFLRLSYLHWKGLGVKKDKKLSLKYFLTGISMVLCYLMIALVICLIFYILNILRRPNFDVLVMGLSPLILVMMAAYELYSIIKVWRKCKMYI